MFHIPTFAKLYFKQQERPWNISIVNKFEISNNVTLPEDFKWYITKVSSCIFTENGNTKIDLPNIKINKTYPSIDNCKISDIENPTQLNKYIKNGIIDPNLKYNDLQNFDDGALKLCICDNSVYGYKYTWIAYYYILRGKTKGQIWCHIDDTYEDVVKKMYDNFAEYVMSTFDHLKLWLKYKKNRLHMRNKLLFND